DVIENGSDKNWFDVFYDETGIRGERRPQLKNLYPEEPENYLLICHRSTSNMRSAPLSAIYNAINETPELNRFRPIKVHAVNLDREDWEFVKGKGIEVIQTGSLNDFLDDIY